MKKIVCFIFILSVICSVALSDIEVLFNTKYAPYSYQENGNNTGFIKGVLDEILKNIDEEVTLMPFENWENNYQKLLKEKNTAITSLVMNSKRKDLFKWVGPIAYGMTYLYFDVSYDKDILSIEDVDKNEKIGVVKDYYSQQILEEKGFKSLIYFDNEKELLEAFARGEIIAAPFNSAVLGSLAEELKISIKSLFSPLILINMDFMYFGFNKDTSDDVIEEWQYQLNKLKSDGKFGEIYSKWFDDDNVPGIYAFLTEDYYPSTFMRGGRLEGIVGDTVSLIRERNGMYDKVYQLPWKIAYEISLLNPNVVIFGMARLENRENIYSWVGPVYKNVAFFYSFSDECSDAMTLDEIRKCSSVSVTEGWWTHLRLMDKGFKNISPAVDLDLTVKNLLEGKSPVALLPYLTVSVLVEKGEYSLEKLKKLFSFDSYDIYIAISKGSDEELVRKFKKTFDEIVMDGSFNEIMSKYDKYLVF